MLVTFQSLETAKVEGKLHGFILDTIKKFKASPEFAVMLEDEAYYAGENPFLRGTLRHLKTVKLDTGKSLDLSPLVDIYSNFAFRIVDQLVNRLWYFPVQVDKKERLGEGFDDIVIGMANKAAIHGACYAFWNAGKIEAFKATEYIPLVCERTGEHVAGIRFWQLGKESPTYIQLFELDGFTEWLQPPDSKELETVQPKRAYKRQVLSAGVGELEIGGENYPDFPIVPLYVGNNKKGLLSMPIKSKINAYDLSETSYFDDFIKTRPIYWAIEGFGGNADELVSIRKTLEALGIIAGGDEAKVKAETVSLPWQSKKELQEALETAIFRDAQVINVQAILQGRTTATAVQFSGIAEDNKAKSLERHATEFLRKLMRLAGIEGEVKFTHKTLMDDEGIMRQLTMAHNWGVPVSALIPIAPVFQGRTDETLAQVEAELLGNDGYETGQEGG